MEMCFRVLAYTQIGTFILVVMSLSWLFSTFLYPALLSTWGLATRKEASTWSCSTRYTGGLVHLHVCKHQCILSSECVVTVVRSRRMMTWTTCSLTLCRGCSTGGLCRAPMVTRGR